MKIMLFKTKGDFNSNIKYIYVSIFQEWDTKALEAKEKYDIELKEWEKSNPEEAAKLAAMQAPKKSDGKPKRPQTAYTSWFKANKTDLMEQYPDLSNNDLISKSGKLWCDLDPAIKKVSGFFFLFRFEI